MLGLKKADYESIAAFFDRGRPITEDNLRRWLDPVAERFPGDREKIRIADFGCGTGRFALPLAYCYGFSVTAVDASAAMLARGRRKDKERKVTWRKADVVTAAWPNESFNAIFMSHLLHHLKDPAAFLRRCFDWLLPGGSVFIRYGALEHITGDPIHRFFPRTVEIDAARAHNLAQVRRWLKISGLDNVRTISRDQRTYASVDQMRECVRVKGTSVLTLISGREHRAGLARLDKYILGHPDDPWLLKDRISLTFGCKPKK
jgi:ubiquinone/menaquinone biosynthesis C-methylase UbiE